MPFFFFFSITRCLIFGYFFLMLPIAIGCSGCFFFLCYSRQNKVLPVFFSGNLNRREYVSCLFTLVVGIAVKFSNFRTSPLFLLSHMLEKQIISCSRWFSGLYSHAIAIIIVFSLKEYIQLCVFCKFSDIFVRAGSWISASEA